MIEKSSFNGDLLGRDDELNNLSMLIEGTTEPLTLAINAAWGAGKTTFVKELWQPYLAEKHGIESFYFSAWENDYSDEPLVSILGEFNSYLSSKYISDSKDFDKIKEAFIDIGKLAIVKSIKKATADVVDVSALINGYSSTKDSVEEFKEQIFKLLASIYDTQTDNKPFVIFIDELDRCRPLYAIEFLERIKHLFNIDRLVFVLCIDKAQLAESIKSQYGNIDTDNYLRRFIDLEYQLAAGDFENFCKTKVDEFKLIEKLINKDIKGHRFEYFHYYKFISTCAQIFQTPLRAVEQILLRLNITLKTANSNLLLDHFVIITFFMFIKHYDSNLYNAVVNGDEDEKERIKSLIAQHKSSLENSSNKTDTAKFLNITIDSIGLTADQIGKMAESNRSDGRTNSDYPYRILVIYSGISKLRYESNNFIDMAIKMIDFTETFDV